MKHWKADEGKEGRKEEERRGQEIDGKQRGKNKGSSKPDTVSVFRKLRQEDTYYKASLGCIVRPHREAGGRNMSCG